MAPSTSREESDPEKIGRLGKGGRSYADHRDPAAIDIRKGTVNSRAFGRRRSRSVARIELITPTSKGGAYTKQVVRLMDSRVRDDSRAARLVHISQIIAERVEKVSDS